MMNVDHLVKMANEIGAFFSSASSGGQAARDVATHLRRYWEPRMRQAMLAHYAQGGAGLTDLARQAVAILAAEAAAPGSSAADTGAAGASTRGPATGPGAGAASPGRA